MYRVFAPVIAAFGRHSAPPPLEPIRVSPPPGVTLHLTNSQLIQHPDGTLFAATRAHSSIGGVVWMVRDGVTTVVLQLGPEQAFANGELVVWPDGTLRYVTVNQAATHITAWPIKEWTA